MPQNVTPLDFEALEGRIQQAAGLIVKLREERDTLARTLAELKTRLSATEERAVGLEEQKKKLQEAESRIAKFSDERTALARRVEQMLDKLRAVEEEGVGAAG